MSRRKLIYEGRTKSVYEGRGPEHLILRFRDNVPVPDGGKGEICEGKGVLNNRMSEHLMSALESMGVPTHLHRRLNMREQLVKSAEIIPLQLKVRNFAAGSITSRLGINEGTQFSYPIVEFHLKNAELNYPLVTREHATVLGWASQCDIEDMTGLALRANDFLTGLMTGVGLKLVDFTLEFGRLWDSDFYRIVVADELSPDVFRLRDIKTDRKLDWDLRGADISRLIDIYSEVATRLGVYPESSVGHSLPRLIH